jgi:molybdopterin-guanine dinucleotide biosynthesis protein MobB
VSDFARVLGVAGWQGSGKTTLLERLVPTLVAEGLSIIVLKHDAHGLAFDVAGKDSDRLFRAGAEVVVDAPAERFARSRRAAGEPLALRLRELQGRCDVVLVEGGKREAHPKVWLLRPGEETPPAEVSEVLAVLPWDGDRVGFLRELVRRRLAEAWAQAPRRVGVLVGGASTRMGTPKQWLKVAGETLLDRVAEALESAGPLSLLGGDPADALRSQRVAATHLPDAPDVRGPLAGILAALRWHSVSWVIASCDLPHLRAEAVEWLLAQREPGRWAVLPRVGGIVQPLLAVYEPQALPMLEAIAAAGALGPSRLEGQPHVATPEPPPELADCWRGVNTPQELAEL